MNFTPKFLNTFLDDSIADIIDENLFSIMNLEKAAISRVGGYDIISKVGKGSYGKVYKAIHRHTSATIALKTTNIAALKDGYMRKHFKREATLLSRLSHPGIVALFEVLETRNHFCMALEFGGENLCDFVRSQKRGRLDEITARSIGRQLTSAVKHIHEHGIVHRDIKLENIMVDGESKRVKIADFGLSNEFDEQNLLKTHCGSPEYAAPELHQGKPYGFEVDIWALGVVLFAMVVGRLPFEVGMKKPVSNQHRRELFLDETKSGVKTMKHQSFMGSASFLFKDLVSKMLNPSRQHRLKVHQVEKHSWVMNSFEETFEDVGRDWKSKTVKKMAKDFDLEVAEVVSELESSPFGRLGGVFNIEKHRHQIDTIALKKKPSCLRLKTMKAPAPATINRPTTSITSNFKPAADSKRPKSAQGKSSSLKPFDNKRREEIHV